MGHAGCWLRQESYDNDKADYRMICVQLLCYYRNPDTHTQCGKYDHVGRNHPSGMKPDDTLEAQKSNDHSSHWEEKYEGDGGENSMSHDDHVHISRCPSIAATGS